MNDVESKTTQIEYSKEGIVQELALLKIKQEVNEDDSASGIAENAYFASTVRLFRFSGLPVRFKRSEIIGEAAKLESQYFRCPGLQQPKPLQAGIHPI